MSTRPEVLALGDAMALRPAVRVASALGAQVAACEAPSELPSGTNPPILLWIFQADQLPAVDAFARAHPQCRVVVLADPSPPAELPVLLAAPWFHHLIGVGAPWFMEGLLGTLGRLLGRAPGGVAAHLPWGARVVQLAVGGSADKARVFEHLEALLAGLGIRGRLVGRVADMADEMLMNALYDAPVDRATGAPLHATRRRVEAVVLAPADQPTFALGSDGQKLVFGITDPFGGLTAETVKRYLAKGLRRGDDQIDRKEGGAGLGLFLMWDGLNSLEVDVVPGVRTEVVGILNVRGTARDASITPKSLNILVRGA